MILINILQAFFVGFWTAFTVTLCVISGPFILLLSGRPVLITRVAKTLWPGVIEKSLGATVEVEHRGKIDYSKPHVFASNHQSMLDTAIMLKAVPTDLHFFAKKELGWYPFVGWYLVLSAQILVDRKNREKAQKSLEKAAFRIRSGANVFLFAEGTRSRTNQLLPLKKGAFLLAIQAQVPIVPVSVSGSGKVWPSDSIRFRPGKIKVIIGEPIPTRGLLISDLDELKGRTQAVIQSMLAESS